MYKADRSFTANNGKYYSYNAEISDSEYRYLSYSDQRNFSEKKSYGIDSNSYSSYNSPAIDYSSYNSSSNDSSSSDNSSSFDFGGGSGGGAGSGGDW